MLDKGHEKKPTKMYIPSPIMHKFNGNPIKILKCILTGNAIGVKLPRSWNKEGDF
jgi:hypothetical protein